MLPASFKYLSLDPLILCNRTGPKWIFRLLRTRSRDVDSYIGISESTGIRRFLETLTPSNKNLGSRPRRLFEDHFQASVSIDLFLAILGVRASTRAIQFRQYSLSRSALTTRRERSLHRKRPRLTIFLQISCKANPPRELRCGVHASRIR